MVMLNSNMKILFISSRYDGGIGGHANSVAEKLREQGYDVDLMNIPHIPIKNIMNPSFVLFGVLKALFSLKRYDVVHAWNVPSAFIMKFIKAKKKILSVHGVYSDQVGILHSKTTSMIVNIGEFNVLKWADKLTTDSKLVQQAYKKKYGLDFIHLPVPLDTRMFNDTPNVIKKENQVVYVGRDSFEKGIDILQKIESKINGNVIYCTNISWKNAMYTLKESSIIVIPSRMESLPQVIKEAFYLKTLVIATNVGGIPEIISNNENGILVLSNDPDKLINSINDMLLNKEFRNKLVENAHDYIIKNFTWEILLPKYIKLYQK